MASISVVVCSIDAHKFEQATASWRRALHGHDVEVIGIHDAASLAEGYNRGIDRASGDLLVFSHDDVDMVTPDAGSRIEGHLASFDMIGIAGTRRLVGGGWYFAGEPYDYMLVVMPHPQTGRPTLLVEGGGPLIVDEIQALDGVFFAAKATVARALRFDAETFDHFHLYDLDFTYRAHLAGYRLAVCRDLLLVHASQGSFDAVWDRYRLRFEGKFAWRLTGAVRGGKPRILHVPLDQAELAEPARRTELARPETLAALVARIGGASAIPAG